MTQCVCLFLCAMNVVLKLCVVWQVNCCFVSKLLFCATSASQYSIVASSPGRFVSKITLEKNRPGNEAIQYSS